MRKAFFFGMFIIFASLLVLGCAQEVDMAGITIDEPYGFWSGLWHGFIMPFGFIGSLFSDSIAMYAKNNCGGWYDFGFYLGAAIMFHSGKTAAHRNKSRLSKRVR